jgi:uncharacterized membrane protein YfcA
MPPHHSPIGASLALTPYGSAFNFGSFSPLTCAFTVTPQLLVTGLWYSLILGIVGGLLAFSLSEQVLAGLFAVLLLYVAITMLMVGAGG